MSTQPNINNEVRNPWWLWRLRQHTAIFLTLLTLSLSAGPSLAAPVVCATPLPANGTNINQTGLCVLNPNGGTNPGDGLQTWLKSGAYQIIRNGKAQIYYNDPDEGGDPPAPQTDYPASLQILLFAENTLVSPDYDYSDWPGNGVDPPDPNNFVVAGGVSKAVWTVVSSTIEETVPGTTWQAVEVLSVVINTREYVLTVTSTYTKPNAFVDVRYSLAVPAGSTGNVMLYHVADMYLDGSDDGPGLTKFVDGKRLVAQYGGTAVGGIIEGPEGPGFTSWYEDYYWCVFGDCEVFNGGPYDGTPYPNTVNNDQTTDAGVGVHWDLGSDKAGQTVVRSSQLFFAPNPNNNKGAAYQHCRFFGNCRN